MNEDNEYPGALGVRRLDNGLVIVIQPMLFGVAVHLGPQDDPGFNKEWSYPWEAIGSALAALEWDGEDDPSDGWTRAYPPYYRRRPDGSRASEYVAE